MTDLHQFKISNLFVLTVVCALAVWSFPSPYLYCIVGIVQCGFIAILQAYRKRRTIQTAIVSGVLWANFPLACTVGWIVCTQHREQGELYCEDGPLAFFVVAAFAFAILTAIGAAIGLFVGYLANFLANKT